jgi:sugar diacid utilization regulator
VTELRRHDTENGTQYFVTLRAWLQVLGDPARAGRQLSVHENTIRYRLRRMAGLTALDLDDGTKRLAMMVEVAALDDPDRVNRPSSKQLDHR